MGESIWGDLPKQVVKGEFNFKKLNCVLALSFSQFNKIIKLYNADWAFLCLYYYIRALRAPSHVKFRPGINFSTRVENNWCYMWLSTRCEMNIFLLHFTLGWKYIWKDLWHIQFFLRKKHVQKMQLQDYIKTILLDFIHKRSKMFNFKTFKIVLLATTNSIIYQYKFMVINLWLLEKIFWIHYMQESITLLPREELLATYQITSPFWGFFQLASSLPR